MGAISRVPVTDSVRVVREERFQPGKSYCRPKGRRYATNRPAALRGAATVQVGLFSRTRGDRSVFFHSHPGWSFAVTAVELAGDLNRLPKKCCGTLQVANVGPTLEIEDMSHSRNS